ncbi:hypothetical protein PUN28_018080 [Cardiocondyla obscurior]|uniref:Uncharacterized protein n=1 Tax=Cardiocondyla obscurior TaxID=286306 RepID=A0AAW2EH78_9HYME
MRGLGGLHMTRPHPPSLSVPRLSSPSLRPPLSSPSLPPRCPASSPGLTRTELCHRAAPCYEAVIQRARENMRRTATYATALCTLLACIRAHFRRTRAALFTNSSSLVRRHSSPPTCPLL